MLTFDEISQMDKATAQAHLDVVTKNPDLDRNVIGNAKLWAQADDLANELLW